MLCLTLLRLFSPGSFSARLYGILMAWSLLFFLWEGSLYSGIFKSALLAPPSVIAAKMRYLLEKGYLQINIVATLGRFLAGFVLAALIAIPSGLVFGLFDRAYEWISPVLNFLRMIPPPAILPFAILVFGVGEAPAVFVIMLGCFFPVFLNTLRGVRETERIYLEVVQTMGGNRIDLLRHAILPSAIPTMMTGVRVGFGIGWLVLASAEIVAADSGLGYMIQGARKLLDTPTIFVGMVTICIIGLTMDTFLRKAEKFLIVRNGGGQYSNI